MQECELYEAGYGEGGQGSHDDGSSGESGELKSFEEIYEEVALNCFRLFGFTSFEQVDRMTLPEYNMLIRAWKLRNVDRERDLHELAWLTFAASAKKPSGKNKEKAVYKTFRSFFDYEKALKKVSEDKDKGSGSFDDLSKFLSKKEGGS